MNKQEARLLLGEELKVYEGKTYAELASLIDEEIHGEKQGPSGTSYQIEIQILWDSQPNGTIRVLGSIDDGGWYAIFPLTDSILKDPKD